MVVGAGAAGLGAAEMAARAGADVCLVETRPLLGGTVTHSLIHTLGGVFDGHGEFLNDGLVPELVERLCRATPPASRRKIGTIWTLSVAPEVYRAVVEKWIVSEPHLRACLGSRVTRVELEDSQVTAIEVRGPEGAAWFHPRAVIDATGVAAVLRMVSRDLLEESHRAAGGLIFRMRNVTPGTLLFPHNIPVLRAIREASETGGLPSRCARAWIDTGVYEDEIYVKLFVPMHDGWETVEGSAAIARQALADHVAIVEFLRRLPVFSEAVVTETGDLGIRDGGRVRGEYCLTEADAKNGRRFPDAVCRCSWPIEYWDPERGLILEYLPEGTYYEIPLRSLKPRSLRNVWVAGKCLSAEPRAQASARVVGSCWSMGEAAGAAAAAWSRKEEVPK
jgi:hypothetical protein